MEKWKSFVVPMIQTPWARGLTALDESWHGVVFCRSCSRPPKKVAVVHWAHATLQRSYHDQRPEGLGVTL